jgi:hypothetical protein
MMESKEGRLSGLGFRFGMNGPHAARTMMLDDLRFLLAHTPCRRPRSADYACGGGRGQRVGKADSKGA